jgi:DHA1 family tetracycline resistance protein-like MFS transporter
MSSSTSSKDQKFSLLSIFLIVFVDLIGFGLLLPLLPYLARSFEATSFEIGALMAIYSLMQFLFAPLWGRLSDRWGRRPLLLMSLIGGGLSYLLFAWTSSLWVLFLARALAGFFAATISTAQAYIADVTEAKDRSKGMGLIGAAFGMGFIFGPLLGAFLGSWGESLGSAPPLGQSFAAVGAGALCFLNFIFCFFFLKEPARRSAQDKSLLPKITWGEPKERLLMLVAFFLATLAMSVMEVMLFPYMEDEFGWTHRDSSLGFAVVGVVMVLVQGVFIRVILKRTTDKAILLTGLVLFTISLYLIPLSGLWLLGTAMVILGFGSGFYRPTSMGLISSWSTAEEQGRVLGVTQSLGALARILGPLFGGWVYDSWSRHAVFGSAGTVALVGLGVALWAFSVQKGRGVSPHSAAEIPHS